MTTDKSFYVTSPIYYVNDAPHIGHAYTSLACDVLARFKRLDGYRVRFLTGTDEHGQKVEKSAQAAGVDPQAFSDRNSAKFRNLSQALGLSNDDFIRTTEPRHIAACQEIWRRLKERGQIYLGSYSGWYSVRDEAYYAEGELVTAPDGEKRAPTGADVEWVEEPSYFFKLSAWQQPLLDYYAKHPDFVLPQARLNEVMSFVKSGLQDLSVSRTSFRWGIPVPEDPAHVMYVWLDALTNYLTSVGFPDTKTDDYRAFWPADVHMVGKDILRFHAILWPAFLMAADLEPPKRVFAHGWWTIEGQKMSKSLRNVVDPIELAKKYGLDQVRYFLLRELPFGNDGDFSHKAIVHRTNGDLANDYGNLAQRVLSLIARNCAGRVPTPGPLDDADNALLGAAHGLLAEVRADIDVQAFHEALDRIWTVVRAANGYVDRQAPWALAKSDVPRMGTVLYVLAETIRHLGLLAQPFMPGVTGKLLDQLAVPADQRTFASIGPGSALTPGTELPKPTGIVPRYVEATP
ncbi:MAG: methionine--tRNA ligase [Rhodospirillales bacterium]|nr:methionine--tRNA ligase [Rhodospirillales bacterium]